MILKLLGTLFGGVLADSALVAPFLPIPASVADGRSRPNNTALCKSTSSFSYYYNVYNFTNKCVPTAARHRSGGGSRSAPPDIYDRPQLYSGPSHPPTNNNRQHNFNPKVSIFPLLEIQFQNSIPIRRKWIQIDRNHSKCPSNTRECAGRLDQSAS